MNNLITNIHDDLYKTALLDPVRLGGRQLFGVSGYASATFARRHLEELPDFEINLIIGMPGQKADVLAYQNLIRVFGSRINVYYLNAPPPVHCKLYSWFDGVRAVIGFSGSANYSQYGFIAKDQINQLITTPPEQVRSVYRGLLSRSTPAQEIDPREALPDRHEDQDDRSVEFGTIEWVIPRKRVRISFLPRNGIFPQRSGLNWGQRPEYNRNPDQAYLSLRKDAREDGFLPPTAITFTLLTDDGKSFDCVVAQQGRKAVHSTNDNSELGKYFRERLGIPHGSLVTTGDLLRYGRTDYTLEKLNNETFLLDFAPPR